MSNGGQHRSTAAVCHGEASAAEFMSRLFAKIHRVTPHAAAPPQAASMRGAVQSYKQASELYYSLASAAVETCDCDFGDGDEDVDDIDTKRKLGWAVVIASAPRLKLSVNTP